jgi:Kef-type K+ transport system membrane component KefB
VIGVLLFQDLLMIFIIVGLAGAPGGFTSASLSLIYMLALCCLALVCQRWLFPLLITRVQLDQEILLLIILAVLFAFIGLADVLSLPTVAGAFLGGFSLSAFPVNGVVRGLLRSLSDFFTAIFFTILGLMVVIPDMAFLFQAILLAALVVFFTPPLVTAVAEWKGFSSRSAIESGLLLAQTSEFSLVIGLLGLTLEHIDQEIFSLLVVVTAITMILTPLIATDGMTRRLLHWHPLRRRMKPRPAKENHILMLGFGASGMWVIKPLQARGHEVLVVEDDPIVVEQLQNSNIPWVRGDASDEKTLAQAGARRARLILCALRRVSDAQKVIQYARGVPVIVRVFEQEDAEQIRRWGGIPIVNAHAAADTFMEWFEKSFRP